MTPTQTPTATATLSIPAEARLKVQCLDVAPTLPDDLISSGVVVLTSRQSVTDRSQPDTLLLDMATGETTQMDIADEIQASFAISPDQKHLAYSGIFLDAEGKIAEDELVIFDANGQRIKAFPWEAGWGSVVGWLNDRQLAMTLSPISILATVEPLPDPMLALDPFSGERQILVRDYPHFAHADWTVPPYWEGWFGTVYDPTLSLVVYPRFSANNEEESTFAIWDLANWQPVASLESVFLTFVDYNLYPMPRWSPDGSQFFFRGFIRATDPFGDKPDFELYRVNRTGQAEQLTHLSDIALIWDTTYSWSPDGRYIALFLGPPLSASVEEARVAVLDTVTLDVTDYCLPLSSRSGGFVVGSPYTPIWSPDGKQFLVLDMPEEQPSRVILVDIEKGVAAQVGEDVIAEGWMLKTDR